MEASIHHRNIGGGWLSIVMGGALAVFIPGYQLLIKTRTNPVLSSDWSLNKSKFIDVQLIIGASLFGIEWGLLARPCSDFSVLRQQRCVDFQCLHDGRIVHQPPTQNQNTEMSIIQELFYNHRDHKERNNLFLCELYGDRQGRPKCR